MESKIKLMPHQEAAVRKLHSGSILLGGVGVGKTFTALEFVKRNYPHLKNYVITTPAKRDEQDWEKESSLIGVNLEQVDSWNNIQKYSKVRDSFFIFDEHKLSGYGPWSLSFIKIARMNNWILLSATPGDNWSDYIPVFLANNYYRTKTEFVHQHIVYDAYVNFPKIKYYINEGKLFNLRQKTLVYMSPRHHYVERKEITVQCDYNHDDYKRVMKERWNIYKEEPIQNASEYCRVLRRIAVSDPTRERALRTLLHSNERVIIFYQYNYEKDIILKICEEMGLNIYQRNKLVHDPVPNGDKWVYVVNYYNAEAWNCIKTDTIIFFSLNYSYKTMEQARGRIDRINTPYKQLKYYTLKSNAHIEEAMLMAILKKKKFNEESFK